MKEDCAECGGNDPECEWCDGTGVVDVDDAGPPAAPLWTVTLTREHGHQTWEPVDLMEITGTYYRFRTVQGAELIVPFSGNIITIATYPYEEPEPPF